MERKCWLYLGNKKIILRLLRPDHNVEYNFLRKNKAIFKFLCVQLQLFTFEHFIIKSQKCMTFRNLYRKANSTVRNVTFSFVYTV